MYMQHILTVYSESCSIAARKCCSPVPRWRFHDGVLFPSVFYHYAPVYQPIWDKYKEKNYKYPPGSVAQVSTPNQQRDRLLFKYTEGGWSEKIYGGADLVCSEYGEWLYESKPVSKAYNGRTLSSFLVRNAGIYWSVFTFQSVRNSCALPS